MRTFKVPAIILAALFLSASSYECAAAFDVKRVTVYSDRALVERESRVKLTTGVNTVIFDAVAYDIEEDSVMASLYAEGSVLSVQAKDLPLTEAPQENVRVLEDKLRQARRDRALLTARLGLVGKKEAFLDGIVKFAQTQVPAEIKTAFPKPEDLQKMLGFLDEGYAGVNKERQDLAIKIEEIDKVIAAMEDELAGLNKSRRDYKKVIEVVFDSAKDQEAKIEVSYIAYGASWEPFYKIEVPEGLDGLTMAMFAKIAQTTGEDWKGVQVSVSSAAPSQGAQMPDVDSWYLAIAQPPRPLAARGMARMALSKAAAPAAMQEADMMEASVSGEEAFMPAEPAPLAVAERKDVALAFEYDLPKTLDIESRDKETVVPLYAKDVKGEISYYAAPSVQPAAFLTMRTSADKEMMAGPASVYLAGRYVASNYLTEKRPQEEFSINLGVDRMVKVERRKIADKVTENFFKNVERLNVIRQLSYKISLENMKDKPVTVRLVDSIPVSQTDKIEVKDVRMTPEPMSRNYQDKQGVIMWEIAIPSGEKRDVSIDFTVTYPKDAAVSGI